MDIKDLRVRALSSGKNKVEVWVDCHTAQDVDDLIAWLKLSKSMMRAWEKQYAKRSPKVVPIKAKA